MSKYQLDSSLQSIVADLFLVRLSRYSAIVVLLLFSFWQFAPHSSILSSKAADRLSQARWHHIVSEYCLHLSPP